MEDDTQSTQVTVTVNEEPRILQLCAAVGMLTEAGPSAITEDLMIDPPLTPGEIRERMSGNLCRCGAYVNIVKAISAVAGHEGL
jgi:aerobic-type carbon monoxide dehydrogenase small subunit (CoxS/CutS family)